MDFRCSDLLSNDGRAPDIPLSFSSTCTLVHVNKDTYPPIIASLQDTGGGGRPGHPFCPHLLVTVLGGGGHSSHNGWYARGDDGALSEP